MGSVENASLMPWLSATALIHSNIVTLKKDKLHSWTALLAIFTFIMSLLGTFLVRSGILNSVHAFANDPYRGVYILSMILLITFFSLAIFIIKNPKKTLNQEHFFLQKDNFILINNYFLIFFPFGCFGWNRLSNNFRCSERTKYFCRSSLLSYYFSTFFVYLSIFYVSRPSFKLEQAG